MPKPSTYNPDALAILASGPDLPLTWQVYSYAGGPARVRFVAPRKGGEPRKVDHFDAEALLAIATLAPAAREALLAVAPAPSPAPDPERARLLSEVSRLRAQVAQFAAGRPAPNPAPSPEHVAAVRANRDGYAPPPAPVVAPAPVKAPTPAPAEPVARGYYGPTTAPRKAKRAAVAVSVSSAPSVSAARAAVLS